MFFLKCQKAKKKKEKKIQQNIFQFGKFFLPLQPKHQEQY